MKVHTVIDKFFSTFRFEHRNSIRDQYSSSFFLFLSQIENQSENNSLHFIKPKSPLEAVMNFNQLQTLNLTQI